MVDDASSDSGNSGSGSYDDSNSESWAGYENFVECLSVENLVVAEIVVFVDNYYSNNSLEDDYKSFVASILRQL